MVVCQMFFALLLLQAALLPSVVQAEKLCKGVQVMSECNARCLNGVFICRGSDLVNKVHLQQDRFVSSVKINASTFSTTWSVPDARNNDRCSVTCPGENNSSFSVTCEKSIFDKHKKGAQPHWSGLGRTARLCKQRSNGVYGPHSPSSLHGCSSS